MEIFIKKKSKNGSEMKKNNNFCLFILVILSFQINVSGQINGISGSKLCAPHSSTLDKGSFEFEPALSVFSSNSNFNADGAIINYNSNNIQSDLLFRITLGLWNNIEFGAAFSSSMEEIFIGSKINVIQNDKFGIALLAGGSLPAGNHTESDLAKEYTPIHTYSIGSTVSNYLSDALSIDTYLSYSKYNGSIEFDHFLNYGSGVGYYLASNFQIVVEVSGSHAFNRKLYSRKLSVIPGFTYDFSDHMGFAFGIQKDFAGINELKSTGYFSAFTMSF
jgi:hypothetical protein